MARWTTWSAILLFGTLVHGALIHEREELHEWGLANGYIQDEEMSLETASNASSRRLLHSAAMLPHARYFHAGDNEILISQEDNFDHDAFMEETEDPRRPLRRRCIATRGDWCGRYERQARLPFQPAPRGSKECVDNCNGVGVCDHDIGTCLCPAGWNGADCKTREKRPCTKEGRQCPYNLNTKKRECTVEEPLSHVDEDGRDLGWHIPGWSASRCAGICDVDTSQCWCDGAISKYGYIPAPKGSPPGTPPLQYGRPMGDHCKPKEDKQGRRVHWGELPYDQLYGPKGWCNAESISEMSGAQNMCGCQPDGLVGETCEIPVEPYCLNQCSGHGTCKTGFCKCHDGWYGAECSRKRAGLELDADDIESGRKPWLAQVVIPPAAAAIAPPKAADGAAPTRKRPLIYVYEVPAEFTTRMLQYRIVWKPCIWRHFQEGNTSHINDWIYAAELYFHEMLLTSPHRTFDPEEADFFYAPVYLTCYFWPIMGWADMPWFGAPTAPRPAQGALMMMAALRWIKGTHAKYWERRQGRDHIWLMAHDEGACWAPSEIYKNGIMLTHWGRMDLNHTSNTGYASDNYNDAIDWTPYQPWDWRKNISGHPCYDPNKDLVIPSLKPPSHYHYSSLLGHPPMQRDVLLYFKGDVGKRRGKCHAQAPKKCYSRGIRQTLNRLSVEGKWREKYKIFVADAQDHAVSGSYSQQLARSLFCLVAPGDGWSARAEDAVLHGCLPVVIMDNVHAVYESILDWNSFSVRVSEASLESLPSILLAYTPQQIKRMQRRLATVWQRFAYAQGPVYQKALEQTYQENRNVMSDAVVPPRYPLPPLKQFPVAEDAFSTILQWLYGRIPHTRGDGAPRSYQADGA